MITIYSTLTIQANLIKTYSTLTIQFLVIVKLDKTKLLSLLTNNSIELFNVLQMLGGPDDGQPSVRPGGPTRGGRHWPPRPARGLPRPRPRPSRPGHRRYLGEGVPESSHHDTGTIAGPKKNS